MEKMDKQFITSRSKSIVLASFSFVMFYVFSYLLNPHDIWWKNYAQRPLTEILGEWAFSMLFCILISAGSLHIHNRLNRFVPWTESPRRRLLFETVLNLAFVILLVMLQILLITALTGQPKSEFSEKDEIALWQWITVSIFMGLLISGVHTGDYLVTNWKNAALEATEHKLVSAQHKQAAAEAELEALKLQLDPHFVFNNLSVLSELILEDQQLGYHYAENFAKVYRYLLINSKKDLISLEDEMKFLNAYVFLLKQRAGDGICFELDVNRDHLKLQLPPMTVQLLIENALKHNKFIKTNPLKIVIRSGADMELIISNTLIPMQKKEESSGLGLKNIRNRYLLLSDREPDIIVTESLFSVSIPLIKS